MSRLVEVWKNTSVCTAALIVVNITVHAMIFLTSFNSSLLAINPAAVYRIISSNYVHGGLFHILMNMMSLYQIGLHLESDFGSLQLIYLTLWAAPLCNIIYLIISCMFQRYQNAVGFSAVLFCYAILESYHTTATSRQLFFITVPAKLYPWALLIIIQMFMPNISFIGHLSGILVGILLVSGSLKFLLPSEEFYTDLQSWPRLFFLTKQPNYISYTGKSVMVTTSSNQDSPSSLFSTAFRTIHWFGVHIWNVLATLCFIFGINLEHLYQNRIASSICCLFFNRRNSTATATSTATINATGAVVYRSVATADPDVSSSGSSASEPTATNSEATVIGRQLGRGIRGEPPPTLGRGAQNPNKLRQLEEGASRSEEATADVELMSPIKNKDDKKDGKALPSKTSYKL